MELRAFTRLEVIDQARILSHRHVAGPAGDRRRRVLGHVLSLMLVNSDLTAHVPRRQPHTILKLPS
jgi:hypothetical protein